MQIDSDRQGQQNSEVRQTPAEHSCCLKRPRDVQRAQDVCGDMLQQKRSIIASNSTKKINLLYFEPNEHDIGFMKAPCPRYSAKNYFEEMGVTTKPIHLRTSSI